MGYKRYEKYKDSGVEWIGEIPEHWNITRVKYICSESAIYGLNETADNYEDDGVRLIRTTDINEFGNLDNKISGVFISEEKAKGYILRSGDILVSRGGSLGLSLYFDEKKYGKCSYASYLVKFRTNRFNHPRYLFYFTKSESFYHQIQTALVSSTISNFNGQKYANMKLPLPSYYEQIAIANFLDQKTAEIDSLIADKEKLIQLLQEKRQAIISEAVTKGLDRNVPMKDSGVEWIGEIPAHWEVKRIKYLATVNPSKSEVRHLTLEQEVTFIPMEKIIATGKVDYSLTNTIENLISGYTYFRDEDIIMAKVTPCFENGNIAIVEGLLNGIGFGTTELHVLRCNNSCYNRFLFYYLQSDIFKSKGISEMYGVAGLKRIPTDFILNYKLGIPNYEEQTAIANFLDQKTAQIDSIISDIQTQIDKLREYRQSLIFEAVTGKIDVRGFTPNTEGVVTNA
jgi:type I restriction enzyme S subunit